jgi:hypothetical protein
LCKATSVLVACDKNSRIGQVEKTHLPFSAFSYFIFSSQRSSSLSKFEKAFEAIRKNDRNCKETLKRSSFRKPKRKEGTNEQVDPISNFDFEKEKKRDNLQQH